MLATEWSKVASKGLHCATYLFPMSTSGEQYSKVPQNVLNRFPGCMYAAEPKSMSLRWNLWSRIIFSSWSGHYKKGERTRERTGGRRVVLERGGERKESEK